MSTSRLFVFAAIIAVASCKEAEEPIVLDEVELDILTEVLLIESVLQDFSGPRRDSLTVKYYDELYDRFGTSAAELDQLRDRYSTTPALWEAAMDTLAKRFERNRGDLAPLIDR